MTLRTIPPRDQVFLAAHARRFDRARLRWSARLVSPEIARARDEHARNMIIAYLQELIDETDAYLRIIDGIGNTQWIRFYRAVLDGLILVRDGQWLRSTDVRQIIATLRGRE